MATTTTNLGLTKPLTTEYYDVGVFNSNADLIDAFLGTVATKTFVNNITESGAGMQTVTGAYTATGTGSLGNNGTTITLDFAPRLVIVVSRATGIYGTFQVIFGEPGDSVVFCLEVYSSSRNARILHSDSTGTGGYIHSSGFTTYCDAINSSSHTCYYIAFK